MTSIIAIDGHAGSGKSTLAAIVAQRLGGSVVRPFTDEHAAELLGYAGSGQFDALEQRAAAILRDAERSVTQAPAVFDRHWVSVLVHLPDEQGERWRERPPTWVCWCDVETTVARLNARVAHAADRDMHAWFVARYRELAERFGVPMANTAQLDPERAADLVLANLR